MYIVNLRIANVDHIYAFNHICSRFELDLVPSSVTSEVKHTSFINVAQRPHDGVPGSNLPIGYLHLQEAFCR